MSSIIISGFPGLGKSILYKENKVNYSDSDSSKFSKKNFPENYIKHIKEVMTKKQLVFIRLLLEKL